MHLRNVVPRLALYLVAEIGICGSAIAGPDFTGTWIRDKVRSDSLGTVLGSKAGQLPGGEIVLTVKHDTKSLQLETNAYHGQTMRMKYILDGKEHSKWVMPWGRLIYRARWDQGRLLIDKTGQYRGNYGDIVFRAMEEWSLSADGRVLTVTTTYFGQQARRTTKQVYIKQ